MSHFFKKKNLNNVCFAFNIWDFESAKAIIDAASIIKQDVILQTSTSVFSVLPLRVFSSFVKEYSEYKEVNALLNLDHCKDKKLLFSAIDNGWDMVMADGSSFSVEENIRFTNYVTDYAHGNNVLVEAEVGQVKGIEDNLNVREDEVASKEDIALFLDSTDIDYIAVAFGNAHGEYKVEPNLHYELVEYTTSITDKPFVVHGASGLSNDILIRLSSINGVGKINISTDLKMAYKRELEKSLSNWKQPIDASSTIYNAVMDVAISKMKLLDGGINK